MLRTLGAFIAGPSLGRLKPAPTCKEPAPPCKEPAPPSTAPPASGQDGIGKPRRRLPPREELVNVFEFEELARLELSPSVYSTIAGSDRAAFDRMTLRPRVMVPTLDLDLSVELFGEKHFTPILVGPVAEQRRYHPDGELATVQGASVARAAVIISSRLSVSINAIAAQAKTPLWYSGAWRVTELKAFGASSRCCRAITPGTWALSARRISRASIEAW